MKGNRWGDCGTESLSPPIYSADGEATCKGEEGPEIVSVTRFHRRTGRQAPDRKPPLRFLSVRRQEPKQDQHAV